MRKTGQSTYAVRALARQGEGVLGQEVSQSQPAQPLGCGSEELTPSLGVNRFLKWMHAVPAVVVHRPTHSSAACYLFSTSSRFIT